MTEKIELKKYVLTVCYDDNNVGYATRFEYFTSNDCYELETLYRHNKCFKKGCCGCNVKNSNGVLLFGYDGKYKFILA